MNFGLILLAFFAYGARAQSPVSTEAWQLQKLISQSEQQLQAIRDQLKLAHQDQKTLEAVSRDLDKMTAGIEQSIQKFQGTKQYEEALLRLQSEPAPTGDGKKTKQRFTEFQKNSQQANAADLENIKNLEIASRTAGQGFLSKIQSEAQLGDWRANARISAQLTELLTELHKFNDTSSESSTNGLTLLLQGADLQNEKQKEVRAHEPR